MSNRRKPLHAKAYRSSFLRSRAWFARRDAWFATQAMCARPLACAGCGWRAVKKELELHHLDYSGVSQTDDGRWVALEADRDLVPMHPYCHELLHRLIDRDAVLSRHRARRAASEFALEVLRLKLNALEGTAP